MQTSFVKRFGRRDGGFTLAEVVVTIVLAGIFFIAAISALQTGTEINLASADMATANSLINEVREWTVDLPFVDPDEHDAGKPPGADSYYNGEPYVDDLDDMLNATFSPPRNSQGDAIAALAGWSQVVNITWRDPANVNTVVANGASSVVFVQVTARFGGEDILSRGWLVTEPIPEPE